MSDSVKQKIGALDQVKIITTKNVDYVSAPPNVKITPSGVWSVVAVLNNSELLCVKGNITIKIPISDVLKITEYDVSLVTKNLGKLSHGEAKKDKQ